MAKNTLRGEELEKHLNYWKNKFGECESLEFPADFHRPSHTDYRGDDVFFEVVKISRVHLKTWPGKGATLFTLFLSAFYVLLNKYTGQ